MKKIVLFGSIATVLVFSNCSPSRKVERVDSNQVIDLSGRWNDTDAKLVADNMIEDVLKGAWRNNFQTAHGKKPTLIIGQIKNNTTEHIDPGFFIKSMEKAIINSGLVSIVQSGAERNEVRDERNDQQTFSSEETRKKWAKELGADYMLTGVMMSISDEYKKQRTIKYQINLELTDLETNEKVWLGDKEIKKYIKN